MVKAIKENNGKRIARTFADQVWNSMPNGHYGWIRAEYLENISTDEIKQPEAQKISIVDPIGKSDQMATNQVPDEPAKKKGCKNCGGRKAKK